MISHLVSHRKTFAIVPAVSGLIILALVSGVDFLHNHQPDFIEHDDCISLQITIIFSAAVFFALFLDQLFSGFEYFILPLKKLLFTTILTITSGRAPPRQL